MNTYLGPLLYCGSDNPILLVLLGIDADFCEATGTVLFDGSSTVLEIGAVFNCVLVGEGTFVIPSFILFLDPLGLPSFLFGGPVFLLIFLALWMGDFLFFDCPAVKDTNDSSSNM